MPGSLEIGVLGFIRLRVPWVSRVSRVLSILKIGVEEIEGELADYKSKAADDDYYLPGVFEITAFKEH